MDKSLPIIIHWIVTYLVDSVIQRLNNWVQQMVAQLKVY